MFTALCAFGTHQTVPSLQSGPTRRRNLFQSRRGCCLHEWPPLISVDGHGGVIKNVQLALLASGGGSWQHVLQSSSSRNRGEHPRQQRTVAQGILCIFWPSDATTNAPLRQNFSAAQPQNSFAPLKTFSSATHGPGRSGQHRPKRRPNNERIRQNEWDQRWHAQRHRTPHR